MRLLSAVATSALLLIVAACGDEREPVDVQPVPERPAFCGTAHDEVSALFCGEEAAQIESLADLKSALKLDRTLFLAHSTALGGRLASSINPRAVLLRENGFAEGYVALTFTRGEQRAELVSLDRETERFNFYLLDFRQACNAEPSGCSHGDLFTPAIESGWRDLRVRDDEELKNTPLDCRRCHGGAPHDGGKPMLLMRELDPPWLHWFPLPSSGPSLLMDDLRAAKGTEPYAGASEPFDPTLLESHVREAQRTGLQPRQPLDFLSGVIARELKQSLTPFDYVDTPGEAGELPSPTWQLLYEDYLEGFALPPPHRGVRATDPDKLSAATTAYRAFLEGEIEQDELPDIGDVLPDDQRALAERSFAALPDAQGEALVNQACGPCHNASLDPTLSRARFDADLSRVTRGALELARARLALEPDHPSAMPPPGTVLMSAAQRRELRSFLATVEPEELTPRHSREREREASDYALEPGFHYEGEVAAGAMAIGDLNGDGLLDLATGSLLFEQRADGTLGEPRALPATSDGAIALVDVDRDGKLDLVAAGPVVAGRESERGLLTYLAEGDLQFSDPIASEGPTAADLATASFVDVDLDGEIDLVTRTLPAAQRVVVYLGDGTGTFTPREIERSEASDARLSAFVLGDVTGDELPDLIVSEAPRDHAITIYAHDGAHGFEPQGTRYAIPETIALDLFLAVGDGNADDKNDLVIGPGIRLMLSDGDGEFGPAPMLEINEGPTTLFDVNVDGRSDLIAFAQNLGEIRVLLQGERGLHRARSVAYPLPGAIGSVRDTFEVRDLSSDECPDVAVSRKGSITVLYGSGCEP